MCTLLKIQTILDKEAALRAARLRRHLGLFSDGAGIPHNSQDPSLSDPPISGGLGGLIPEPSTSHPIIKKRISGRRRPFVRCTSRIRYSGLRCSSRILY